MARSDAPALPLGEAGALANPRLHDFVQLSLSMTSPMHWHCLQHVPFEGPGHLATWVAERRHTMTFTKLWEDASFPPPDQYDGLFILGGPMNVYEDSKYTWLTEEKKFIALAVKERKPVLGICLGAQLLSITMGGSVTKSRYNEIGWFPIHLTRESHSSFPFCDFPDHFMAFHWHGDRFSIPPGATHVANSDACHEQAFVYKDHVVGVQFHLESTYDNIASLIEHCGDDIGVGPYIQHPKAIQDLADCLPSARYNLFKLLDSLIGTRPAGSKQAL